MVREQCFKTRPTREPEGATVRVGYMTGYAISPLKSGVTQLGQLGPYNV